MISEGSIWLMIRGWRLSGHQWFKLPYGWRMFKEALKIEEREEEDGEKEEEAP